MPDNELRVVQKRTQGEAYVQKQLVCISDVEATADSEDHAMQAGPSTGLNTRISPGVVQAVSNGVPADLKLNPLGGESQFGGGVTATGDINGRGGAFSEPVEFSKGLIGSIQRGDSVFFDGGSGGATFSADDWIHTTPNIVEVGTTFKAPASGSMWVTVSAVGKTDTSDSSARVGYEIYTTVPFSQFLAPDSNSSVSLGTTGRSTASWMSEVNNLVPEQFYYVRLSYRVADPNTVGTIYRSALSFMPRL
jgi:hypothetical protein